MVILLLMDSSDPKMSYHKVFDAAAYPRFLLLGRWHM